MPSPGPRGNPDRSRPGDHGYVQVRAAMLSLRQASAAAPPRTDRIGTTPRRCRRIPRPGAHASRSVTATAAVALPSSADGPAQPPATPSRRPRARRRCDRPKLDPVPRILNGNLPRDPAPRRRRRRRRCGQAWPPSLVRTGRRPGQHGAQRDDEGSEARPPRSASRAASAPPHLHAGEQHRRPRRPDRQPVVGQVAEAPRQVPVPE